MEKHAYKVGGMSCGGCVKSVTGALQALPGVGAVDVSLERGEALVEHGPDLAPDVVRQAIEEAGFDAE